MNGQLAFHIDASACSGCKTCQVACKDKHDLEPGIHWRRVYEITGGDWEKDGNTWKTDVFSYFLSLSCNHCADPICVNSCPNRAITKRPDGVVIIDQDRCMGCRYCEWSCPYGAPRYDERKGRMGKCHLCHDYIDQGRLPSCVAACPMRVLDIGAFRDLVARYGEGNCFPLPDPSLCKPSLVMTRHPNMERAGPEEAIINNREEVGHA